MGHTRTRLVTYRIVVTQKGSHEIVSQRGAASKAVTIETAKRLPVHRMSFAARGDGVAGRAFLHDFSNLEGGRGFGKGAGRGLSNASLGVSCPCFTLVRGNPPTV